MKTCAVPQSGLWDTYSNLADTGVSTFTQWDNCGKCRQGAYGLVQESILRQLGIDARILTIRPGHMIGDLKRIVPEISRKQAKGIIRTILREIWKHDSRLMEKQAAIGSDKPRIGVCGEIFTVLDKTANFGIMELMEAQGAQVHNALPLSQFVFKRLLNIGFSKQKLVWLITFAFLGMWREIFDWYRGKMKRPDIDQELFERAEKETVRYLANRTVGGHGRESITWAIYYALAGYDGVVHIMPFPCMPEATVSVFLDEVSKDYGIPVTHLVFDQQFGVQNLITRAEATVEMLKFRKDGVESLLETKRPGLWLGVDVGSTSTKAVLMDGETLKVVDFEYQPSHRMPMEALKNVLGALFSRNPGIQIAGMATTGSGRRLAQALLGAPLAINEISCQTISSMLTNPGVRSIIDVGGQDNKIVFLDESGVPTAYNMNSICSAGTGAFLDTIAREFKVPVEQLGDRARASTSAVTVTGRCVVFATSDIVSKQQAGCSVNDVIKATCRALARNCIGNLCRSQKPKHPVMFTGGVALNPGVVDAFSELLGEDVIVHPHCKVSGALGAAFLAMSSNAVGGLGDLASISEAQFGSKTFTCNACANACEVSLIYRNGKVVFAPGSQCHKYDTSIGKTL